MLDELSLEKQVGGNADHIWNSFINNYEDVKNNHSTLNRNSQGVLNLPKKSKSNSTAVYKNGVRVPPPGTKKIGCVYVPIDRQWKEKRVAQLDIETSEPLRIYSSAKEAGEIMEIRRQSISACCNKSQAKQAGGFKWRFAKDYELPGPILKAPDSLSVLGRSVEELLKYRKTTSEQAVVDLVLNNMKSKVTQCDIITGKALRVYESASDAEYFMKICQANISSCCRNKLQMAGGFGWRYPTPSDELITEEQQIPIEELIEMRVMYGGNEKRIVQIGLNTGTFGKPLRIYTSVREAGSMMKIGHSSISNVCTGRLKSAGGFRWRFARENETVSEEDEVPIEELLLQKDVDSGRKGRPQKKRNQRGFDMVDGPSKQTRGQIQLEKQRVHELNNLELNPINTQIQEYNLDTSQQYQQFQNLYDPTNASAPYSENQLFHEVAKVYHEPSLAYPEVYQEASESTSNESTESISNLQSLETLVKALEYNKNN